MSRALFLSLSLESFSIIGEEFSMTQIVLIKSTFTMEVTDLVEDVLIDGRRYFAKRLHTAGTRGYNKSAPW